jgi:transposase
MVFVNFNPLNLIKMEEKESAMKFIKELKRKTRKRYNSEEKIVVVLAGFKQEESIAQICRNHGITPATYYKWSKDFMEAGKHRLQGDTLREANTTEVKTLKRENEELTHMFKEVSLELRVLKKNNTSEK